MEGEHSGDMDAPLQGTPTSPKHPAAAVAEPIPSLGRTSHRKVSRHYRTKPRDSDPEEQNMSKEEEEQAEHKNNVKQPWDSESSGSSTSPSSTLAYVQSQNAQNLGEVYPRLARLSFLDQEGEGADQDGDHAAVSNLRKTLRPLQQNDLTLMGGVEQDDKTTIEHSSSGDVIELESSESSSVAFTANPPMTSPSASSSGARSGLNLVEVCDTGSATKGRGLFSIAKDVLKPGTLVFRELAYCQVVNDACRTQVCSACFKDVREELGEEEMTSSAGSVPTGGQRKLVRCAGCKVVWYCNKASEKRTCQLKDWKLHHQLECQGIQQSMTNPVMKDVWTRRAMDTTTVRALCRLVRRRERVKASTAHKAMHGKPDTAQKQVNEVYFSGLDQKEEEWLDEHGSAWIEQYLNTYSREKETAATSKNALDESRQLAKIMAVVMSCVVSSKQDRHMFLKRVGEAPMMSVAAQSGASGLDLLRKLDSYGFAVTNMETTAAVGLALYVQCMPFMNHSCVPNCVYTFKGARVECRVIRDIQPGEEIGTTQERQKQLKAQYHFMCDCPLCKYYPANPLVQPDGKLLTHIASEQALPDPGFDPKQGYICSNASCGAANMSCAVLATDSQLKVYNKVELKCNKCGQITQLTQEIVQENEEQAQRLLTGYVREMNVGSAAPSTVRSGSRIFELAKAEVLVETSDKNVDNGSVKSSPIVGGMATVQEIPAQALRSFEEAYRILTGRSSAIVVTDAIHHNVFRHPIHHLVRQLVQTGFDEAVRRKSWVFALQRSLELERILCGTYVGHHPLKAIQAYYTCKIANLLANLLLEESTVEIEESEEEKEGDDMLDSEDENDLKAIRDAMRKDGSGSRAAVAAGNGSMQEQLLRKKRKAKDEPLSVDNEMSEREIERSMRKTQEKQQSSRGLLQYLKSLIPKIEDPDILQQYRVCWGKDGKLGTRYRYQIDSLKQALHYAELPFVPQDPEKQ
ncbi:SET and MYND domain-containing protein 3 [Mortierella claussenii]|nr:SET and MYND domain-containing protein 3 [Mortierella claussenii]